MTNYDKAKARKDHIAAFWADPQIHPVADMLPMMSAEELKELAADIKANGLQQQIVLWEDNSAAAVKEHGEEGPFPLYLLDGRNRLAALKLLGITDPCDPRTHRAEHHGQAWLTHSGYAYRVLSARQQSMPLTRGGGMGKPRWEASVNPTTFVLSMNVRRRHLTTAQKRDVIAAFIKADPKSSNRTVGKELGVDHKTAGKVRDDLEARGEIPHVATRTDSKGRSQPARKPGARAQAQG